MLTFTNTNRLFLGLLVLLTGLDLFIGIPVFIYPVLLLVYSLIVFRGCYLVHSNFFIPVVCSVKTTKNVVALSFDDGPADQYTPETLRILDDHNVKAAFFCIGKRIAGNETIFQQLIGQGHLVGNHSYSHHFWFDLFSSKKMLEDMKRMDHEVERVGGLQPKLFRPPYGVTNPNLKKAITMGGYIPVGWSIRSMDTVIRDEKKLYNRIVRSLKPGAIILFHDTSKTTITALPNVIRWIKESGYEIVRLDKMLHLSPYA